jgi:CBS domain-containing protein
MGEEPTERLRVVAEEIIGDVDEAAGATPLASLFHRVWSVVPERQELVEASPDDTAGDALARMAEHDYSQLPVRVGQQVLGVFSYRSFARRAPQQVEAMRRTGLRDMPIDGLTDRAVFVSPYAELPELFDIFDTEEAVFVGDEQHLEGVVTTVDVLRWLHDLAEPFVRLGEIEKSLREIVVRMLSAEQIRDCARRTLEHNYEGRLEKLPSRVEALSFDELRLLVIDGRNWPLLEPSLGRNNEMAKLKLAQLPALRNDVFHFRRDLEAADMAAIRTAREWLLGRLRILDERAAT